MKKILIISIAIFILSIVFITAIPKLVLGSSIIEKNFNKETSVECNSTLGNVFTDGKKLYMYFPEEKTLCRLVDDYWMYDYSFKKELSDREIKDITDDKYTYLQCKSLKIDNSDFVCINKVIYTIYTFDLKGDKTYVLAYLDTNNEKLNWHRLAYLPTSSRISMTTLAVYNGNLYVVGGYNEKTKTISKNVYEYNLKGKKWIKKDDLPGTRFASTANQVGDKLIVSFGGKSDGKVPCNLIYDGKSWKKSTASVDANVSTGTINNIKYYKPSVGIVSGGLIYSGMNSKKYGNTFYYDIATDTFKTSGYKADANTIGVAIANKYFTLSKGGQSTVKSIPVKSALLKLTVRYPSSGIKAWINADICSKTNSNDNIYNTYYYMPGEIVGFKLSDVYGYYYSHFKVDDKEIKGYLYNSVITTNKEIKIAKARKVDLIQINKKSGALSCYNTLQLKATLTNKNATPVEWKVNDTRIATISSSGVITPKVSGIDKTVEVTAKTTLNGRNVCLYVYIDIIRPEISYFRQDKVTNSSATLSWSQVKGADGYDVFRFEYSWEDKKLYKTVNTNKITIKNLKPSKYYTFIVQAYKIIDNKKCYSYGDSVSFLTSK